MSLSISNLHYCATNIIPFPDYIPVADTFTFSEGMTRSSLNVTLINDNFVEGMETFGINLEALVVIPGTRLHGTIIDHVDAGNDVVTILDDDSKDFLLGVS